MERILSWPSIWDAIKRYKAISKQEYYLASEVDKNEEMAKYTGAKYNTYKKIEEMLAERQYEEAVEWAKREFVSLEPSGDPETKGREEALIKFFELVGEDVKALKQERAKF